jgi:hypothetical protein
MRRRWPSSGVWRAEPDRPRFELALIEALWMLFNHTSLWPAVYACAWPHLAEATSNLLLLT